MNGLAGLHRLSASSHEPGAGGEAASHGKPRRAAPSPPPVTSAAWRQLPGEIDWRICRFGELSPIELARIYRARQQVFAIEQQCIYLDADEYDEISCHFAAWSSEHVLPLAYARLLNPGTKYAEPSIGRVLTTSPARGLGLGRELVRRVIAHCAQAFPGMAIRISAQERLERFYADSGFGAIGSPYQEDGIPHLEMLRQA
ncbi:MAG TPA: GNAT family N-acetyltransferase [Burkholderiaceae bacterium]|nr:GNAT family N-acetyltransferase [Burkholderiaceae bacterium]